MRSRSRGEIQELKTRWRERRERARERERAGEERERERESGGFRRGGIAPQENDGTEVAVCFVLWGGLFSLGERACGRRPGARERGAGVAQESEGQAAFGGAPIGECDCGILPFRKRRFSFCPKIRSA